MERDQIQAIMSGLLVAVYDIAEEGVSMLDCEGSLITVEPIRSLSEMEPSGVSLWRLQNRVPIKIIVSQRDFTRRANCRRN